MKAFAAALSQAERVSEMFDGRMNCEMAFMPANEQQPQTYVCVTKKESSCLEKKRCSLLAHYCMSSLLV